MSFDRVVFPTKVSRQMTSRPTTRTDLERTRAGYTSANALWSRDGALRRWTLDVNIREPGYIRRLDDFYQNRQGPARTFLFFDWLRHLAERVHIATADGATTTFQLAEALDDGPDAGPGRVQALRPIVAPIDPAIYPEPAKVAGQTITAPTIYFGDPEGAGTLQSSGYTIEYDPATGNGGQITFTTAPPDTTEIYLGQCWFYHVAGYVSDEAGGEGVYENVSTRHWQGVELEERRL